MKRRHFVLLAAGSATIFVPRAWAADTSAEFVQRAAVSNMFEIESSRLALKNATAAEIKAFADRMVVDHTKAGKELKSVVDGRFKFPTQVDAKHKALLEKLEGTDSGFDKLYSQMQTNAHEEAVALFSAYVQAGGDAPLQKFAAKTLPVLEEHYEMIKMIDKISES